MPMARQIIETIIDDIDGGEASETVAFGLDGTTYEIDLNDKNAAALRKALDKFIGSARKVRAGSSRRSAPSTQHSADRGYDIVQLREWQVPKRSSCRAAGVSRRLSSTSTSRRVVAS
jgi:hypothetical protein